MSDDVVIRVEGLWKRYGLPLTAALRRGWRRLAGRPADDGPWALRDVNLEVRRGETLGIIGRNGAGKSTLLKVLAGVTPPTRGRVELRGRIFPMIELNAGVHPELTGRENVRLLAAVMGLRRRETEAKLPDIEEFCELGEWFDRPVRMYSSGMLARLGFGVAMNVEADVLLIDEVLAVGDLAFQRKCFDRLEALRQKQVTTVFVSHRIRQVERICPRTLLFRQGLVHAQGETAGVCNQYYLESHSAIRKEVGKEALKHIVYDSSGELAILDVTTLNTNGEPADVFRFGEPMTVRVRYQAARRITHPIIGIDLYTTDMLQIAGFNNTLDMPDAILAGNGTYECRIERLVLLPGVFTIGTKIKASNNRVLYHARNLATFQICPDERVRNASFGLLHLDTTWRMNPPASGWADEPVLPGAL